MPVLIFCEFGFKMPIHVLKIRVLELIDPKNWEHYQCDPQRTPRCAETRHMMLIIKIMSYQEQSEKVNLETRTRQIRCLPRPPKLSQIQMDLHIWSYPWHSYSGFRDHGVKIGLYSLLGFWVLQQETLY